MSSKVILGTVQFGLDYGINNASGKPSKRLVFDMLDYAYQHDIKILDTADAYGNASEILGNYNTLNRDRFFINTKFKKNALPIIEQLKITLEQLQTIKINTYFYHSFNDFKCFPELIIELKELKGKNLIEKIGLSVYENEEFKAAIESKEIDVIQLPFNMLDNNTQRGKLLKDAKSKGKEIQIRSVFLQGLFFKPFNEIPVKLSSLIPYLQKIRSLAKGNSLTIEQLALQYAVQQPEIDQIIIGVDNLLQLQTNLKYIKEPIPEEIIKSINKINVKETELLYPKNWN